MTTAIFPLSWLKLDSLYYRPDGLQYDMNGGAKANMKTSQLSTESLPVPKRGRGRPREFDRAKGLRKAMQVFWSLGYEATSMADLREAFGIKQASLYAAYGSKEELFREAVALYQQTDGIATPRALAVEIPTREAIQSMLQDAVDMFTEADVPRGCLLVLSTINCTAENKGIQEHLSALREQDTSRHRGSFTAWAARRRRCGNRTGSRDRRLLHDGAAWPLHSGEGRRYP